MERFTIKEKESNPSFIGAWNMKPLSISSCLIDYFELNQKRQKKGRCSTGFNPDNKDSIDITIRPKEIITPDNKILKNYFEKLFECHQDYISQWPFLKSLSQNYEIGSFNIQKYNPGQHFKKIHTERTSLENLHRVFAFMTYLNDVILKTEDQLFLTTII